MTVRLTMNYAEVDISTIEDLIADDRVAFEQKVDGTRSMAVVETQGEVTVIKFLGRGGGMLMHTAAMQHFSKIKWALLDCLPREDGEIVLDGEIMIDTGQYVIFDLPYLKHGDEEMVTPDTPLWERTLMLSVILQGANLPIRQSRMMITQPGKRDLFEAVKANNGEGIMAKRLDSPYEPGGRASHSVKVKFTKTADVVVTGSTRGRNEAGRETGSFSFAVHDGYGKLAGIGACSAIGKPEVKVGDVIEVAYLAWTGSGLVQPRMIRVRDDKSAYDCTVGQLPLYSKEVL